MTTNKKIFWLVTVLFVPILVICHFLTKKTKASMAAAALLVLFTLSSASGCATIMTGTTQKVPITSTPSGAVAKADGTLGGVTPCTFTLERKTDHTIEISKEGYRTASVILRHTVSGATAGNALIGGLIGLGVDATTGAMYKLVPERVDVVLEPKETFARDEPEKAAEMEKAVETVKAQEEMPQAQVVEQAPAAEAVSQISVELNSDAANAEYTESIRQEVEGYLVEQNSINESGEVWMCFTLQPSGNITDLKVVDEKTTGSDEMRGQCLLAVNSLYPFSAFPEDMPKEPVTVELGIISQLQN